MSLVSPHAGEQHVGHVMHLYGDDGSLEAGVADFVRAGLDAGEAVVLVVTRPHLRGIEGRLAVFGVDLAAARADGRYRDADAGEALDRIMRDGTVDRDGFVAVVGPLLDGAAAGGRPVRAFGEMVGVLWDRGDVAGAIELEDRWNELMDARPLTLLCAYPAASPAGDGPDGHDALDAVCARHAHVVPTRAEPAGMIAEVGSHRAFDRSRDAPREARRFVVDALTLLGVDGPVLDDVALVATELATNAVLHARTGFRVSVARRDGAIRVEVVDGSPVPPVGRTYEPDAATGRGLPLLDAVTSRWGTRPRSGGKVVWAELPLAG